MPGSRTLRWALVLLAPCMAAAVANAQQPYRDKEGNWHDLPPTYSLACRGPLNVQIGLNSSPPVTMEFRKGRKPATSGVDPGTCAWMDRGISDREPSCLQHYASGVWVRVTTPPPSPVSSKLREGMIVERRVGEVTKGAPAPSAPPAPPPGPPTVQLGGEEYINYIATSSDKVAYFRAFSVPGQSCFMVERTGP